MHLPDESRHRDPGDFQNFNFRLPLNTSLCPSISTRCTDSLNHYGAVIHPYPQGVTGIHFLRILPSLAEKALRKK